MRHNYLAFSIYHLAFLSTEQVDKLGFYHFPFPLLGSKKVVFVKCTHNVGIISQILGKIKQIPPPDS